jgi:hypothetical protein
MKYIFYFTANIKFLDESISLNHAWWGNLRVAKFVGNFDGINKSFILGF